MFCFFFFKQKTAYEMRISDWSSDVCSSDLNVWSQTFADHEILVASRNPSATARQITQYLASQSGRVRVIDAGSLHHAPLCDMLLTQARGRYVAWYEPGYHWIESHLECCLDPRERDEAQI